MKNPCLLLTNDHPTPKETCVTVIILPHMQETGVSGMHRGTGRPPSGLIVEEHLLKCSLTGAKMSDLKKKFGSQSSC